LGVTIVEGDLLDQPVEAIVNAWNRNTIPWWLLLPQGVSGAIKRRAGTGPFNELRRHGRMSLGQAIATGAGSLPYRAIIHVASINDAWRGSEFSIRESVKNAIRLAGELELRSVAFPILGAGSGGFNTAKAEAILLDELQRVQPLLDVVVVRYKKP